jgi:hypothetical protein
LGQSVVGHRIRSSVGVTSRNATLPGFSDDHPSRRPRPGRALTLAVRAPEALRQRIYTTSVDATGATCEGLGLRSCCSGDTNPPRRKGRARSLAAPLGFDHAISTPQRPQNPRRSTQTCPPEQA